MLLFSLSLLLAVSLQLNLDDRFYCLLNSFLTDDKTKTASIWLPSYQVQAEGLPLPTVEDNASGITYNAGSDTLFVILNGPTAIIEMDTEGLLIRRIPLIGFHDTEGITWLGNDRYAVVEERKRRLSIITIRPDTREIIRDSRPHSVLSQENFGNKGFEGIAYFSRQDRLFVVKEREPMMFYEVENFSSRDRDGSRWQLIPLEGHAMTKFWMDDLSGLHFDNSRERLLVLSDKSKSLAEVTLGGRVISFLEFSKGFAGLTADIPQAEGVAMDKHGRVYVVSEPNLLYIFKKGKGKEKRSYS